MFCVGYQVSRYAKNGKAILAPQNAMHSVALGGIHFVQPPLLRSVTMLQTRPIQRKYGNYKINAP